MKCITRWLGLMLKRGVLDLVCLTMPTIDIDYHSLQPSPLSLLQSGVKQVAAAAKVKPPQSFVATSNGAKLKRGFLRTQRN